MSDTTADAAKRKRKRTAARLKAKRLSYELACVDWFLRREIVEMRDGGLCRACGATGYDAHHIKYRSAGGADALSNLVLLCVQCHEDEHAHRIRIMGTADDLRIERRR
jgi:5-methylcytosine-specific restriction endonuclease McrA